MTGLKNGFVQIGLVFLVVLAGIVSVIYFSSKKGQVNKENTPNPSVSPSPQAGTNGLKEYTDGNIKFSYPASWEDKERILKGSGYTKEFKSPDSRFLLTFTAKGNYSQTTGKPFVSLREYAGMPYDGKKIIIDRQGGMQYLPRAGSEHINSVDFFSEDKKFIYTLSLQSGENPMDTPESDMKEGQLLFDLVLSTFRFNKPEAAGWLVFETFIYDFQFKYPPSYVLQEDSGGGARDNLGNISVAWFVAADKKELAVALDDKTEFSLTNLRKYAPTGAEGINPEAKTYGGNTFYYYGAGGGGVCYPDQYFYNLNGKVLVFRFSGCENDKQPPPATKEIEKRVLESFKL